MPGTKCDIAAEGDGITSLPLVEPRDLVVFSVTPSDLIVLSVAF